MCHVSSHTVFIGKKKFRDTAEGDNLMHKEAVKVKGELTSGKLVVKIS